MKTGIIKRDIVEIKVAEKGGLKMSEMQVLEKERRGTKIPVILAYVYISLPFIIFSLGWLRKRYSFIIVPLIACCLIKIIKETDEIWYPKLNADCIVKIIMIVLLVAIWVYFSGIGKYVYQNKDHGVRNTIFEMLVNRQWPVINYEILEQNRGIQATSLIYYIGFWLPAAIIGKVFGLSVGYGFQFFWAVLGILLFYYFLCVRIRHVSLWPLVVFIFFSGLDLAGHYLIGTDLFTMENDLHLEQWIAPYQYSSMTTQLFWVFNQAIPAWLCTIMVCTQKNNQSIVFILACCMLQATFPFVGLILLVGYFALNRVYKEGHQVFRQKKYNRLWLRDTFTVQNVVGGGIIGIVSFGYLNGNLSANRIMQISVSNQMQNNLLKFILFILLEVGIYIILLYQYHKNDVLYYFMTFCLCIIPLIKVGSSNDFCMRASIPFLILLYIYTVEALEKSYKLKEKKIIVPLMIALLIGSITPLHEFTRTIQSTLYSVNNGLEPYINLDDPEAYQIRILNGSNFSGSIDDNLFYRYFIKRNTPGGEFYIKEEISGSGIK